MSNEMRKYMNSSSTFLVKDEAIRETIDDITASEPKIDDHMGSNGAIEGQDENKVPEITPNPGEDLANNGKVSTTTEKGEEKFERVVRETIEEITPLYQQAVTLTQDQRDRYRRIGEAVNKKRDEISGSYGSKFIPRLAEHLGISASSLRDMCDYAKVDSDGMAIPSKLVGLSWRRVVQCAKRAKEERVFRDFLNSNLQLIELDTADFDKLLREKFPKKDTRGRKPNSSKQLSAKEAQKQAIGLGGNGQSDSQNRPPLPEKVNEAFKGLVSGEDSPWKDKVNVYSGETGFDFHATFTTETECVTVFKHFISYLDKEAA